jgi:uncharacterized protein YqiB (DUF1249 family)
MPKQSHERDNWEKLLKLVPNLLEITEYQKLTAPGFMDLGIDVLEIQPNYRIIALSHYYKHDSGDMLPDPDVQIRLFPEERRVEVMAYQDVYSYQEVYVEEGVYRAGLKLQLDTFLNFWLGNLLEQGHKPIAVESDSSALCPDTGQKETD